ncbi:MAG: DNA repair protein RecO, partial [Gammaproteobacteria bacterium]
RYRMKTELHPAYVLHYRPYRETSLLLDTFSRDYGRVSLIAKGAKRKGNGTAFLLQPYQRLLLAWSGKSELMTLTRVELDSPACVPDQERLIAAFYINELVMRLLHQHEAHPELFSVYDMTITALTQKDNEQQAIIRIFEKRLLQTLGYGLVLDHDVETGMKINIDLDYYYLAERGPVRNAPEYDDHVRISGMTLNSLLQEDLVQGSVLQESKRLMRYILQKHLGRKPLASRELYASYMSMVNKKQTVP